jgi:phospholipid/cholesterol/gamma-HCH transport system substrate-binding protein
MAEKNDPASTVEPRRAQNREVWVGLFVILGVTAVLATLFTLTDAALFRGRYIVSTVVPDAGGIRRGDPVQMRGVNIGRVQAFRISHEGVEIRLEIEGEYEIPKDSRVELKSFSLLSGLAAIVVPGSSTEYVEGGDKLPGSSESGIMETATNIADEAEKTLARVQALLSEGTVENVEASSDRLKTLLGQLSRVTEEQRKELNALVTSLRVSAGQVEKAATGPELESALKRIDLLTQKANATVESLQRSSGSLETLVKRIENGEGTLGKLSSDDALYTSLNKTVENLNNAASDLRALLQDVKKNPKRYVKFSLF